MHSWSRSIYPLLGLAQSWSTSSVYKEDYFALLNATETGHAVTYTPSNIVAFTAPISKYVQKAVIEVKFVYILVIIIHSKINIDLLFKPIYHTVCFVDYDVIIVEGL